jgi:hypothetical protein
VLRIASILGIITLGHHSRSTRVSYVFRAWYPRPGEVSPHPVVSPNVLMLKMPTITRSLEPDHPLAIGHYRGPTRRRW